jgi:hypothetical protein
MSDRLDCWYPVAGMIEQIECNTILIENAVEREEKISVVNFNLLTNVDVVIHRPVATIEACASTSH